VLTDNCDAYNAPEADVGAQEKHGESDGRPVTVTRTAVFGNRPKSRQGVVRALQVASSETLACRQHQRSNLKVPETRNPFVMALNDVGVRPRLQR